MAFCRPIRPMGCVMKYIVDISQLVITLIFLELNYLFKILFQNKKSNYRFNSIMRAYDRIMLVRKAYIL